MKRIGKNGKKRLLKITYINTEEGKNFENIMKEICLCYLEKMKLK